jgi:MYXO-CTERM domain-containing protein
MNLKLHRILNIAALSAGLALIPLAAASSAPVHLRTVAVQSSNANGSAAQNAHPNATTPADQSSANPNNPDNGANPNATNQNNAAATNPAGTYGYGAHMGGGGGYGLWGLLGLFGFFGLRGRRSRPADVNRTTTTDVGGMRRAG